MLEKIPLHSHMLIIKLTLTSESESVSGNEREKSLKNIIKNLPRQKGPWTSREQQNAK